MKTATILKIIAWPLVALLLVTVFMFLFRSSIDRFISKWESLKMGGVEVKVENELDKNFLENLLSEREAYIFNMEQNVDSLTAIIGTLREENHQLLHKLEDATEQLSIPEKAEVEDLVNRSHESLKNSSNQVETIKSEKDLQYRALKSIVDNEKFKEAAKQENKGFELLLADDCDAAIKAFQQSEKNFPTVQQKKQALSDFINENMEVLRSSDTDAKKRIFSKILKEYSSKMAPALKKKFERKIKE